MRLAVTGLHGQVVSAMIERAPRGIEIIALGRPRLDLTVRDVVLAPLTRIAASGSLSALSTSV